MNDEKLTQFPSTQNAYSLPSVWSLLKEALSIYKNKIKTFLVLTLILLFVPLVAMGFPLILSVLGLSFLSLGDDLLSSLSVSFIIGLLLIFILSFLAILIVNLLINVSLLIAIKERETQIKVKELFALARHKILSYLWISFLVGVITLGGFILFIIPGIIMSVWFSLALIVFISEDKKGKKALARSKQLVKGRWWSVFWKFFVFNVIILTATLILGVIPFFGIFLNMLIVPFNLVFYFLIYEKLKEINVENREEPKTEAVL
jgi:hypothetical protein